MNTLKKIVPLLNDRDINCIKMQYKSKDKKKCFKLFKIILSNNDITDVEAKKRLYKGKCDAAYSNLKVKLKHDLLNYILNKYREKISFEPKLYCAQLIHQAQALLSENEYALGITLLMQAFYKAEKAQLNIYKKFAGSLIQEIKLFLLKKSNAMERLFRIYVNNQKFLNAENVIKARLEEERFNALLKFSKAIENDTQKWLFRSSILEFTKDKFENAQQIVYQNHSFKDNIDLHILSRYLDILCDIELKRWRYAGANLSSFDKWLKRHKESINYDSINQTVRILGTIIRHENFNMVLVGYQDELNNNFLQPFDYDAIQINNWLTKKL